MAIRKLDKMGGSIQTAHTEFIGKSTDIKPSANSGIPNGSVYYEMDTTNIYMFDEESQLWILQSGEGGNGGGIQVDLSNYYTKPEIDSQIGAIDLSNYFNKSEVQTEIEKEKYTLPQASTKLGGVVANPKESTDTTEVRIDTSSGILYCTSLNPTALDKKQDAPSTTNTNYGVNSGKNNTSGASNVAIGHSALAGNLTGSHNTAIGYKSSEVTTSYNNTSIGSQAFKSATSGHNNVAVGTLALSDAKSSYNNTAIGTMALKVDVSGNAHGFSNCAGIGAETKVNGNNQVQLGNPASTVYAYGAVQDRSDSRDKTDIQDTSLGLDFINKLRPVEFKWDYREDYIEMIENADGEVEVIKLDKDGSKKRDRFHQGFIAQEVKQVMDEQSVDFGGYQDHKINGGGDVLSLGYTEFIAPMVKAIQEQQKIIEALQSRIEVLENKGV